MIDKIIIFSYFYYEKKGISISMLNFYSEKNKRFAIEASKDLFFKLKTKEDFNIILNEKYLKVYKTGYTGRRGRSAIAR